MSRYLRAVVIFLVSCLLATLYAAMAGLISHPVRTPLILWPIFLACLWFAFSNFNLLRFTGYVAVLPVSVLAFEIVRTILQPPIYAYRLVALDRSHYMPGTRISMSQDPTSVPDSAGWGMKETVIGEDGFRADPDTGKGNSERCSYVLIGDSMIYGSGLRYADTLRPVLASMGVDACVFGITGNGPTDYLSTLKYVASRLDPGAHIAIYIYAYNDFVSLSKYYQRRIRALSSSLDWYSRLIVYYDDWRRTTFTQALFRQTGGRPRPSLWQYKIDGAKAIKFYYPHDPAQYVPTQALTRQQRVSFEQFLQSLNEFVRGRPWRVSVVIHPDNAEVYANVARQARIFEDRDRRRADGVTLCRSYSFGCEDITHYLYERLVAEGKNPYLIDDRHFSEFGTRVVAEHYIAIVKRKSGGTTAD